MSSPRPLPEVIGEDEIIRRRRTLLLNANITYAELIALDEADALDPEQRTLLIQVKDLDRLMADDTDQHYAAVARVNALYNDAMLDNHIYGDISDDLEMFLAALRDAIGEDLHKRHTRAAARAEAAHRGADHQL